MKTLKKYDDFIIERYLSEEFSLIENQYTLNENKVFDKLKGLNKEQLKEYFDKTYNYLKTVSNITIRINIIKLLFYIYIATFAINNIPSASAAISNNNHQIEQIAKDKNITHKSLFTKFKEMIGLDHDKKIIKKEPIKVNYLKDASELHVSQEAIDTIKSHEKLRMVGYNLGDKHITIGYGHAELIGKSKFRVGQKISEEKAEQLLRQDLKVAADGVRRMFAQWKEEGTDIKITQGMFDAMVSIAFNAGVSGLRNSEFIDQVKNGNLLAAADLIPTTRNSGKYPGLNIRREAQKELYLDNLEKALS